MDSSICYSYISNRRINKNDRTHNMTYSKIFTYKIPSTNIDIKCTLYVLLPGLSMKAFINLPELTELNVEHCRLQTLKLNNNTAMNLNILLMEGNPLKCDCDAIWLWKMIHTNGKMNLSPRNKGIKNKGWNLPRCATPFSVKNNELNNLKGNVIIICTIKYICI